MTEAATETTTKRKPTRPKRYDKQITVRISPKVAKRLREIQRIHRFESMSQALRHALTEMLD